MLYHLTSKVSFDKADYMSIPFEAVTKPFSFFSCLFSFLCIMQVLLDYLNLFMGSYVIIMYCKP